MESVAASAVVSVMVSVMVSAVAAGVTVTVVVVAENVASAPNVVRATRRRAVIARHAMKHAMGPTVQRRMQARPSPMSPAPPSQLAVSMDLLRLVPMANVASVVNVADVIAVGAVHALAPMATLANPVQRAPSPTAMQLRKGCRQHKVRTLLATRGALTHPLTPMANVARANADAAGAVADAVAVEVTVKVQQPAPARTVKSSKPSRWRAMVTMHHTITTLLQSTRRRRRTMHRPWQR